MNIMIVFGGRDYKNRAKLDACLNQFKEECFGDGVEFTVMTGGARGADTMALEWANENELDAIRVPARWKQLKKAAGMERNRRMLELAIKLTGKRGRLVCIGFPGGIGTNAMERLCLDALEREGGFGGHMWLLTVN